jgi:hypothetical protein
MPTSDGYRPSPTISAHLVFPFWHIRELGYLQDSDEICDSGQHSDSTSLGSVLETFQIDTIALDDFEDFYQCLTEDIMRRGILGCVKLQGGGPSCG